MMTLAISRTGPGIEQHRQVYTEAMKRTLSPGERAAERARLRYVRRAPVMSHNSTFDQLVDLGIRVRKITQHVLDARFGRITHDGQRQAPLAMKPTLSSIGGQPFLVIVPVSIYHLYRGVRVKDILDSDTARAVGQMLNEAGISHYMVRGLDVIGTGSMQQEGIFFVILMVQVPALAAPDESRNLPDTCTFDPRGDYPQDGKLHWLAGHDGEKLVWVSLDRVDHALIGGTTQWGKTNAWAMPLLALLLNHDPAALRIAVIDPKRITTGWLVGCPHLFCEMCRDDDMKQARDVAEAVFNELEERKLKFDAAGVATLDEYNQRGDPLPRLLFIFDEYLSITLGAQGPHDPLYIWVKKIINQGRAFGIQAILATQKPDANAMESRVSSQCNTRIAVHCTTAGQFQNVMGNGLNAWMSKLVRKGRVLMQFSGEEKPRLLQMPWIETKAVMSLAYWRPQGGAVPVTPPFRLSVLTDLQWKCVLWSGEHTAGTLNRSAIAKALGLSPDVVRGAVENLAARGYAHSRGPGLPYAPTPKLDELVELYRAQVGEKVGAEMPK